MTISNASRRPEVSSELPERFTVIRILNAERGKPRTRLKRRHCAFPISSVVVRHISVTDSLFAAFSRKFELMVAELTVDGIVNFDATYE